MISNSMLGTESKQLAAYFVFTFFFLISLFLLGFYADLYFFTCFSGFLFLLGEKMLIGCYWLAAVPLTAR